MVSARTLLAAYTVIFMTFLSSSGSVGAQSVQVFENGSVHEAFVTDASGVSLLVALPVQPPKPINETIPRKVDIQAEWLTGYWKWIEDIEDFVWVSGVWRRAPPGHQWISGFWKQYEKGWVRIPGFWSRVAEQNLDYINIPPPDPIDENMPPPPTNSYFWVPGYWQYLFDKQQYFWVPGRWEELDNEWVLIPSHYTWRPGGYVFVPAYWDWAIEERGTAYAAVSIAPEYRFRAIYEPIQILKPSDIVFQLFPSYPDYLYLFRHHYHFHPEYWETICCPPPWWGWDTWWCFSVHDQWGLWWWYTHPGYPQPTWVTKEISGILPPPLSELLVLFKQVSAPPFITKKGVVSEGNMLNAISKKTGEFSPILPAKDDVADRIKQLAARSLPVVKTVLKPIGRRLPVNPTAFRPQIRKPAVDLTSTSRVARLPDAVRPHLPPKPRIPSLRRPSIWGAQKQRPAPPSIAIRRPSWTPRPQVKDDAYPGYTTPSERAHHYSPAKEETPPPQWHEPRLKRPPVNKRSSAN